MQAAQSFSQLHHECKKRGLNPKYIPGDDYERKDIIVYMLSQFDKAQETKPKKLLLQLNSLFNTHYSRIELALLHNYNQRPFPQEAPPYSIEPYISYVLLYLSARNSGNVVFLNEIIYSIQSRISKFDKVCPSQSFIRSIINQFIKSGYDIEPINHISCISKICKILCLPKAIDTKANAVIAKHQIIRKINKENRNIIYDEFLIMAVILVILNFLYKFDNTTCAWAVDDDHIASFPEELHKQMINTKNEQIQSYPFLKEMPSKLKLLSDLYEYTNKSKYAHSSHEQFVSHYISHNLQFSWLVNNYHYSDSVINSLELPPHVQPNPQANATSMGKIEDYMKLNSKYVQLDQYSNPGNEWAIVLNSANECIGERDMLLVAIKYIEAIIL